MSDEEDDMDGNFSRDAFTVTVAVFGGLGLLIAIAISAWVWSAS